MLAANIKAKVKSVVNPVNKNEETLKEYSEQL